MGVLRVLLTYLNVYLMQSVYSLMYLHRHLLPHWDEIEDMFAEDDE